MPAREVASVRFEYIRSAVTIDDAVVARRPCRASTSPETAEPSPAARSAARSQLSALGGHGARRSPSAIVRPDLGQRRGARRRAPGSRGATCATAPCTRRPCPSRSARSSTCGRRESAGRQLGEGGAAAPPGRGRRPRATSHPNASNRPAIGSTDITSSVSPSRPMPLRSTIATRLPRPKCDAACAASQTWPSFSSWSPSSTQTRVASWPRSRAAAAMPTPIDRPCPSEPDEKSMPGTRRMSGWSPSGLPSARVAVEPRRAGSSRARPAAGTRRRRSGPWRGSAGRAPAQPDRRAGASRRSRARRGSRRTRRRSCSGRSSRSRSAAPSRIGSSRHLPDALHALFGKRAGLFPTAVQVSSRPIQSGRIRPGATVTEPASQVQELDTILRSLTQPGAWLCAGQACSYPMRSHRIPDSLGRLYSYQASGAMRKRVS